MCRRDLDDVANIPLSTVRCRYQRIAIDVDDGKDGVKCDVGGYWRTKRDRVVDAGSGK